MSRPDPRPIDVVLGAMALLMLGTAVALLVHGFGSAALPLFRRHEPALPAGTRSVSVQEAHHLMKQRMLFIDARSLPEYESGHVPGALHLHPAELATLAPEKLAVLAGVPGAVVYCEGASCGASRRVAEMLADFGLADLAIMTEGFPAWERAGFPVEVGGTKNVDTSYPASTKAVATVSP
ncbi:MAG: hypothetical protein HY319_28960 [Armatimonadetes bacterium]|nr:hypothetical protein [Armatimonadota bacterium]